MNKEISLENIKTKYIFIITLISAFFEILLFSVRNIGFYIVSIFILIFFTFIVNGKKEKIKEYKLNLSVKNILVLIISAILQIFLVIRFNFYWASLQVANSLLIIISILISILGFLACFLIINLISSSVKEKVINLKNNFSYIDLLIYVVFLALMIIVIANKIDYYLDEICSYGLANSSMEGMILQFNDGVKYNSITELYYKYLTVSNENMFNYSISWIKQAMDVHPPVYYALVHTICSFFPGTFSKWYAGVINIIFALLTLVVVRKISDILSNNSKLVKLFTSISFITSFGILSSVSFLRMYVLAMFFVSLLLLIVFEDMDKDLNWQFFAKLYFVSLLASLTHYYCIVFVVILCFIYLIMLAFKKQWKKIFYLFLTGVCVAISAYLVFPDMIYHMFSGYRGEESITTLKEPFANYLSYIKIFYNIINGQLFGGLLTYFLILIILLLIIYPLIKKKRTFKEFREWQLSIFSQERETARIIEQKFLLGLISTVLYFLFVSKIAVYQLDRYMMPIFSLIILFGMVYLILILKRILNIKILSLFFALSLSFMTMIEFIIFPMPYLYSSNSELLNSAKNYSDVDCLFIYSAQFTCQQKIEEVKNYKSITFLQESKLDELSNVEVADNNSLILIIHDSIPLDDIIEKYPQFTKNLKLGQNNNSSAKYSTYYLYSE